MKTMIFQKHLADHDFIRMIHTTNNKILCGCTYSPMTFWKSSAGCTFYVALKRRVHFRCYREVLLSLRLLISGCEFAAPWNMFRLMVRELRIRIALIVMMRYLWDACVTVPCLFYDTNMQGIVCNHPSDFQIVE